MDEIIDARFKGLTVLLAQTDARIGAIQAAIGYVLNEEQKASFERHYASLYQILLRRKIESIEDVDPMLAIELQRVLNHLPKEDKGGR